MELKEIMDFNKPYNELNIKSLIEDIKSNCVVPYLGAGMSMLSENIYPSWNAFLWNTFEQYLHSDDRDEFNVLSYEDKAEFLYSKIGKITFADILKRTFGEKLLDGENIDFVQKPVYMLPIIFSENLLITTNYDKVIEKIYGLHGKILTVAHPGHIDILLAEFHGD